MNKIGMIIITAAALLLTLGAYRYLAHPNPVPVACTMEAKLCPDGSAVGRTGPRCEFTACPTLTPALSESPGTIFPDHSGLHGTVTLGPTCPVARIPPDPHCADKPYSTKVTIFRSGDPVHPILVTKSDVNGQFLASLPPGDYTLSAGQSPLPHCADAQATVSPNTFVSTTITCDTGIR